MKNKNILLLIFYLLLTNNIFSQFDCTILSPRTSGDIPDAYLYIPDANTPIEYLRVNIHFILRSVGDPAYPGNFTKYDDGDGHSDYTGYDYAQDLIDMANYRLSWNTQMKMPPGNSTDDPPRQYRYILNGVFFHEDNNYYYWPSEPTVYNINTGDAINLYKYHIETGNTTGGGKANMSGGRWVCQKGAWEGYVSNYPDFSLPLWVDAGNLNHEIGHNLSLFHTMREDWGPCNLNKEDYCADTPTGQFIIDNYGFDPCCGWGGGTNCTNNQMDYTGEDAITPLQLGREHWTIANEMYRYKNCYYYNNSIDITSFTDNMAYIASSVTIPSGYSILVDDYNRLFVNCENFEIDGEFEITTGCELTINPIPTCN